MNNEKDPLLSEPITFVDSRLYWEELYKDVSRYPQDLQDFLDLTFQPGDEIYMKILRTLIPDDQTNTNLVLDIGSGMAPERYFAKGTPMVCLDLARQALHFLKYRTNNKDNNPQRLSRDKNADSSQIDLSGLVQARAEQLPFKDGSFPIVHIRQTLGYIEDSGQVVFEMDRVLKPGGLFILTEMEDNMDWAHSQWLREKGYSDVKETRIVNMDQVEFGIIPDLVLTVVSGRKPL